MSEITPEEDMIKMQQVWDWTEQSLGVDSRLKEQAVNIIRDCYLQAYYQIASKVITDWVWGEALNAEYEPESVELEVSDEPPVDFDNLDLYLDPAPTKEIILPAVEAADTEDPRKWHHFVFALMQIGGEQVGTYMRINQAGIASIEFNQPRVVLTEQGSLFLTGVVQSDN